MSSLPNDRWRRFAIVCTQPDDHGQVNFTQAAEDAGFGTPESTRASLAVIGHRLAHDPRMQAAMKEVAEKNFGAALPAAVEAVINIMMHSNKNSDKLKAAAMIFDRGGMPIKTQHEVKVERVEDFDTKVARAVSLAKSLGLDPAAMLAKIGIEVPASLSDTPESGVLMTKTELIEDAVVVSVVPTEEWIGE
ncbi:MAG: hypothetical protein AB7F22_07930 [Reyranella sp.]